MLRVAQLHHDAQAHGMVSPYLKVLVVRIQAPAAAAVP